jgi:hypothetical protein
LTIALATAVAAGAQNELYQVSSKAQGAPFDLVVTEVAREATFSKLKVPGFHERTAPEARWLMCTYTDLAVKRGFKFWTVMYPEEQSNVLVVGFSNSPSTSPADILGSEYKKERVVGEGLASVERSSAFCGIRQQSK